MIVARLDDIGMNLARSASSRTPGTNPIMKRRERR